MTETRLAKVRAAMGRAGWQRTAPHTATAGRVTGRGPSQQAALDDLGAKLAAACERDAGSDGKPSFAWDADNECLWVAVPDVMHGGHTAYIVNMRHGNPALSPCVMSGNEPASEAFTGCLGFTPVIERRASS